MDEAVASIERKLAPALGVKNSGFGVLYESDDIFAFVKPAGVATIPTRRGDTITMIDLITEFLALRGIDAKPNMVHRLDIDTSGALLCALTKPAAKNLMKQFEDRAVNKEYLAIVRGTPRRETGTIELKLSVNRDYPDLVYVDEKLGKPSISDYEVLEKFKTCSLVRVVPHTGRTHQIRVHLAHIGHPLMIDTMYGSSAPLLLSAVKRDYRPKDPARPEKPILTRMPLHCRALEFEATSGDRVRVEAEIPDDMKLALKHLRKYALN
ncbi:MAG: RNA pseudouridine synthase [Planctomycetes bacterium]|nr:RNA pseudouridine synthase [Planctomycetota bacterium]